MASFIVLTPETGPGSDHEKTRFIRDGFSLIAFLFPGIWLLCHRLWLCGIGALMLQGLAFELMGVRSQWSVGFALLLAISILTAVEGPMLFARSRLARGFVTDGLVSARDLAEAEDIYFSEIADSNSADIRPVERDIHVVKAGSGHSAAVLGLIGYDGGR